MSTTSGETSCVREPDHHRELTRRWRGIETTHLASGKRELDRLAGAPPILLPTAPIAVIYLCPRCCRRHDIPTDLVGRSVQVCTCGARWKPVTQVTE
jgi:hypothetical protein